ncbi:MAG: LysM peptidoglycan-binding domain-containing protein [Deltaproteobacteria bacterium]|nr:LysM peptidoglycan-binding domain-containing protein [Deltaproteobacteria bacterium]MBM4297388.1 LysM peptidoglycan-binding domain-containing protein [Deltaproteobacteria bacterium]
MFFNAAIVLLGILLSLVTGCVPAPFQAPPRPVAVVQPLPAAPAPPPPFTLSAEFQALAEVQDELDDEAANGLVWPAGMFAAAVKKEPEKPAQAAKPIDDSPTALQRVSGPLADDRLLDLLEKDLDKAVSQAPERRRLQLSKAVTDDPKVRHYVTLFSKTTRPYFAQLLARSGKYMPMIVKTLREAGLPDEMGYLALIESAFIPHAKSPAGAAGLWQFVPDTARIYGLRIDSWVDERFDPAKSTRAAASYLKDLHERYGRWFFATAAYNSGPSILDNALQRTKNQDFQSLGVNRRLSAETRNFVPKFVAAALIATDPRKYGFEQLRYETPLEYDEVEVREPMKLETIAAMTGSDLRLLTELNPALLRGQTPPGERNYRVKIPEGRSLMLAKAMAPKKEIRETVEPPKEPKETKDQPETEVITYEVKRGETLYSIARRYGQTVRSLMALNGLTSAKVRAGQQLRILVDTLRGALR